MEAVGGGEWPGRRAPARGAARLARGGAPRGAAAGRCGEPPGRGGGKREARAEMYFKQAVAAEPADGEAMRRYAIFLWHARGDMAAAEDMFTDAIDEEPESSHIRSSYAWFLWMTGGLDTCLVDTINVNDDAE
ncbi:hypothetical protein EJB05_23847, partial [Eragrostis curvula]